MKKKYKMTTVFDVSNIAGYSDSVIEKFIEDFKTDMISRLQKEAQLTSEHVNSKLLEFDLTEEE